MNPIPSRRLLPRGLPLLWFLSIAIALGSWRFLVVDMALVMPAMVHHAMARPWMLYAHIGLAPVALALLPFQFSQKLRRRRLGLHRWLGRLYGLSVLSAGIAAFGLGLTTQEGPIAGAGLIGLAIAWLGVTGIAIWLAMSGNIAAHRRWMIRSAALTAAAITLRLYLPIGQLTVGFEASYPWICWLCWLPNMMFAEWLLRRAGAPALAAA